MTRLQEHPLYNTWKSMITRCTTEKSTPYSRYGGRGITVCERWMPDKSKPYQIDGFINFLNDIPPKPGNDYSLDRINNNGNYELSNCKWSTRSEQQSNKRKFKQPNNTGSKNKASKLTEEQVKQIKQYLEGKKYTQDQLAEMFGVSQVCISLIKRNKKWVHVTL